MESARTQPPTGVVGRVFRDRRAVVGAVLLATIMGACVLTMFYTFGASGGVEGAIPRYNAGDAADARLAPGWSVFRAMGTDEMGRSVLLRCLAGGGISLTIGLLATFVSVVIGTLYGAIAGYCGGRTDAVMMRTVDVLYSLPYVLLVVLLAVASDAVVDEFVSRERARSACVVRLARESEPVGADQTNSGVRAWLAANPEAGAAFAAEALKRFPPREIGAHARTLIDLSTLLAAIGGVSWLTTARVIRGQVLSLKAQPFVEAARAVGAAPRRVFFRHLLPNLAAPIVVYATLTVPQAILQESFLSFLGIGVKPPMPSWGGLAARGVAELNPYRSDWWLLVFPCGLLGLTLLSLNFIGESIREAVDPNAQSRPSASR